MIALAFAALALAAGALSLVAVFGLRASAADSRCADARVEAAKSNAGIVAATIQIARADEAVSEIEEALRRANHRGDVLEQELTDAEANPISLADPAVRAGRARLREALRVASSDRPRGAEGGDGTVTVPLTAPAGAAGPGAGASSHG